MHKKRAEMKANKNKLVPRQAGRQRMGERERERIVRAELARRASKRALQVGLKLIS